MSRRRKVLSVYLGAATTLFASSSAHAQAWIGQVVGNMIAQEQAARQRELCMTGTAMPDSEIAETHPTVDAAMAGYWQAVHRGGAADVTPYFFADNKVSWTAGDTRLDLARLSAVTDPLASGDAVLVAAPLGYVRAGDGRMVWGQWRVNRADGRLAGTYDALFRRTGSTWKLSQMTLVPASQYVDPVVQFCSKPNDVLPYRLLSTQAMRDQATRRAGKMQAKAQQAHTELDRATAKGDAATITEARLKVDEADRKAAGADKQMHAAIEANDHARADAADAEAKKAAAMAALHG